MISTIEYWLNYVYFHIENIKYLALPRTLNVKNAIKSLYLPF